MKRIITLLLLTLSVYGAFSQDVIAYQNGKTPKRVEQYSGIQASEGSFLKPENKSPSYKSFTELMYAAALTRNVGSKGFLTTSHGIMIEDVVFVGAAVGLGYEPSKPNGQNSSTTSENVLGGLGGIDLRLRLSKEPMYFYIGGKAGGAFALKGEFDTGFFYNPNFGYVSEGKKVGLSVSVGFMGLPASYYTFDSRTPTYNSANAQYLTLSGGITF